MAAHRWDEAISVAAQGDSVQEHPGGRSRQILGAETFWLMLGRAQDGAALSERLIMRVGISWLVQNFPDWGRYLQMERGETAPPLDPADDARIWAEEIDIVLKLEDQGFDSIWAVEHHVTPYTMIPNPLQALSFIAGATSRIDVGTQVIVVPWHNPLRVAEEITVLQHLLRGRRAFIGLGRGLGRREFAALSVDQNESRGRFIEGVQVIRKAIEEECFSYEGTYFRFDRTTMRPRPRDAAQLLDDMCFSWGSPASATVGASLGLRPLLIPQKDFEEYTGELAAFAQARTDAGFEPARPKIHLHMYCHEDPEEAERGARRFIPEYVTSAELNYELSGTHFADLKGYEHYAAEAGKSDFRANAWMKNSIWGTPQECLKQIQALCDAFHPEEFLLSGRFGSMPADVSARSIDLFAREVLPAVHEIPTLEPIQFHASSPGF